MTKEKKECKVYEEKGEVITECETVTIIIHGYFEGGTGLPFITRIDKKELIRNG